MYLVTLTHSRWGEDQSENYYVADLDQVPKTIAGHLYWLESSCGVEIEYDEEEGFDLDLSIVKYEETEYDEDEIFSRATKMYFKEQKKRQKEWAKNQIKYKQEELARLKKELGED